jgi:secreted protein with Ig-like and vWFA domain
MDVLLSVASAGMTLFDDEWQVGLWTFSTNLSPGVDYQPMIPVAPMSENRPKLQAAIDTIEPIPGGATGLYDTLLAAYKEVQSGWDPYYVNSVILITDGQNDDSNSPTLDQLIASLQALMDPRYPVQVIMIGLFNDVNQAELERITDTTGGGTFIARSVGEIGGIFLQALAVRPPVPTS